MWLVARQQQRLCWAARRRRFRAASVGRVVLLDVHVEAREQQHIKNDENAERVRDVAARETHHRCAPAQLEEERRVVNVNVRRLLSLRCPRAAPLLHESVYYTSERDTRAPARNCTQQSRSRIPRGPFRSPLSPTQSVGAQPTGSGRRTVVVPF